MMQKTYNRKIRTFFEYLIALSLVLHLRTIWSFSTGIRNIFTYVNILLLIIGTVGAMCTYEKHVKRSALISWVRYSIIVFFVIFVHYLVAPYDLDGSFRLGVSWVFIISYLCLSNDEANGLKMLYKFSDVVLVVTIISLFFWLFGSIMGVIRPTTTLYSEWNHRLTRGYYGIYYEPQTAYSLFTGRSIIRNCAIFTEAPMCSFAFSLALLTEVYLKRNKSLFKLVILSMGILSTVSSTGYIMLILIFYVYFLTNQKNTTFFKLLKVVLGIASAAVCFVIFMFVDNKLASTSGSIRMNDFVVGIKAWSEHLIIGNGLNNMAALQDQMASWRSHNMGFSNSVMQVLSDGGILLFLLYIIPVFIGFKDILAKRDKAALYFGFLTMGMFVFTIVSYTNIMLFIVSLFATRKLHSENFYRKMVYR